MTEAKMSYGEFCSNLSDVWLFDLEGHRLDKKEVFDK